MPRAAKTTSSPEPGKAPSPRGSKAAAHDVLSTLTYTEARTALELTLAELQSSELDVEAMAGLYRRALAYADRCENLLETVEQEVKLWDTTTPASKPEALQP